MCIEKYTQKSGYVTEVDELGHSVKLAHCTCSQLLKCDLGYFFNLHRMPSYRSILKMIQLHTIITVENVILTCFGIVSQVHCLKLHV